jgi:hypothetical protein
MRENAAGETISAAFISISKKHSKSDLPKFDFENLQRKRKEGVLFRRLRRWPVLLVPRFRARPSSTLTADCCEGFRPYMFCLSVST